MIFKLQNYVNGNKKMYIFIEAVLDYMNIKSETFYNSIGVKYGTVRTQKSRNSKNYEIINKAINKLELGMLDFNRISAYEKCINDIYTAICYKDTNTITMCLELLDIYIDEFNCLRPIFILFRILGTLNIYEDINIIRSNLIEEAKILRKVNPNYFDDDLKIIYYLVMQVFDYKIDNRLLDSLLVKHPNFYWLFYTIKISLDYVKKDYENGIKYCRKLNKELTKNNFERRILINLCNLAFFYNKNKNYIKTIQLLNPNKNYFNSKLSETWIQSALLHYLYASFMLRKYADIIDLVIDQEVDINSINWIIGIILISAGYKVDRLKELSEIIDKLKYDDNINSLLNYYKNGKYSDLKLIKETNYTIELIKVIKTFKHEF